MKYKEVVNILKIARPTLYNYVKQGKIRVSKINHSLLDYNEEDVFRIAGITNERNIAIYVRSINKFDIESQTELVSNYANKNGYSIDNIYKDISNGFTLNRVDLEKLIQDVCNFKIKTLFILNKDILSIDSFEVISKIFEKNHCNIEVINKISSINIEDELKDLRKSITLSRNL